jgi:TonB family protein
VDILTFGGFVRNYRQLIESLKGLAMFDLAIAVLMMAAPTGAKPPEPKGDPASWITAGDYPATSLTQRRGGTVTFRLEIDRKGEVTGCEVTESSGYRDLDEATCRVMAQRGQFDPARDAKGRRALGAYFGKIVWQAKGS